jgi:hypothetical protein
MNKPFFYLTNYIIHSIKNSVPHQEKGVLNMGNCRLPLALMALILSLFLINPVSAYNLTINANLNPYFMIDGHGGSLANEISVVDGNVLFDFIGTSGVISRSFIWNAYLPDSQYFDTEPYLVRNASSRWIDFPFTNILQIDFDLNIRDFTGDDVFLVLQTSHLNETNDTGYYEEGRSQIIANISELGTGQHHISLYGNTVTMADGTVYSCRFYDDINGYTYPTPCIFSGNLDGIWLGILNRYPITDGNVNITFGNLTYTVETVGDGLCSFGFGETSANSPDCAIPVSNISSLYANLSNFLNIYTGRQFIKINVTNIYSQQSMEGCIRGTLRMQDVGTCWGFVDSSSPLILQGYNHIVREESEPVYYMERMLLDNQHPSTYTGQIVQVVGLLTDSYLDNYYLNTSNQMIPEDIYLYVYNITPIGTAPSGYTYYDTYPDYTAVPSTSNSYGLTTYNLNPVSVIYYYIRYNSTHLTRTNMNTGATFWTLVDAKFISTTVNTTYYLFQYPNFEAYLDGSTPVYMFTTVFDSRYNNTSPIKVISYETMINQTQNNTSNKWYYVWSSMITEHNSLNIIGDGICGSLESDIPSDWNYSPDCRFGGLSGYASAVGARSMQMFTLFLGVVFLILSVLVPLLMRSDLTTELIIMSAVGILISIPLIAIGLSFIITP